jgi:hypothetical protein
MSKNPTEEECHSRLDALHRLLPLPMMRDVVVRDIATRHALQSEYDQQACLVEMVKQLAQNKAELVAQIYTDRQKCHCRLRDM